MNPKFLLGGASLVGGGGLVSAGVIHSGQSSSETKAKTALKQEESPSKEVDKPAVSKLPSTEGYACHIVEVDKQTPTKVVEEKSDQVGFLDKLGSEDNTFKQDVKDACTGSNSKTAHIPSGSKDRYVYVYKNESGRWMYSATSQTSNWNGKH
ncbi:hypothetical protein HF1_12060 [Mycoplasma haemofelis str. Langford 1]|uniref:Uncharacterized protein n=1 Tax=Mycoplasma haemofelis (strain Langford 1) TaxID=941640 RepID=E8ZJ93_MYCHL|nr:hypothetical protein [Mycoplasma haemofelis]CBY93214.1 hypothetical protein HF1_12060 [Mycoplasma haemofelis str. Langford 1]